MNRKPGLLLHPLFIISIALLLLNDFYWKAHFSNAFTGKISDFAGLFAFTVFWIALFNQHKKIIVTLIAIFFLWWKSPVSKEFISFINTWLHLPLHRVIDYSDWMALLVLPFAYHLKEIKISRGHWQRFAVGLVGLVSFFSFSATSMIRRAADDNRVKVDQYYTTKQKEEAIVAAFRQNGILIKKDSAIFEKNWNATYYVPVKDEQGVERMVPLQSLHPGIYTKIDYGSIYTISEMSVAGDTLQQVKFIISEHNTRKQGIRIHSFEYKKIPDSVFYFSSYGLYRKFKKPLKKRFREITGK